MMLRDAAAAAPIRSDSSLDDDLRKAQEAVELGLEIIYRSAKTDESKRYENQIALPLLERIKSTPAIDAYELLKQLKKQLSERRGRSTQ